MTSPIRGVFCAAATSITEDGAPDPSAQACMQTADR